MNPNRSNFEKALVLSIPLAFLIPFAVEAADRFNIPSIVFGGCAFAWVGIVGLIFIIKDKL
jgi:cyanate permease